MLVDVHAKEIEGAEPAAEVGLVLVPLLRVPAPRPRGREACGAGRGPNLQIATVERPAIGPERESHDPGIKNGFTFRLDRLDLRIDGGPVPVHREEGRIIHKLPARADVFDANEFLRDRRKAYGAIAVLHHDRFGARAHGTALPLGDGNVVRAAGGGGFHGVACGRSF